MFKDTSKLDTQNCCTNPEPQSLFYDYVIMTLQNKSDICSCVSCSGFRFQKKENKLSKKKKKKILKEWGEWQLDLCLFPSGKTSAVNTSCSCTSQKAPWFGQTGLHRAAGLKSYCISIYSSSPSLSLLITLPSMWCYVTAVLVGVRIHLWTLIHVF